MDTNQDPKVIILKETCTRIALEARKTELERRKKANALLGSVWHIRPEDYKAADEAAFDAMWAHIMRQKALICGEQPSFEGNMSLVATYDLVVLWNLLQEPWMQPDPMNADQERIYAQLKAVAEQEASGGQA